GLASGYEATGVARYMGDIVRGFGTSVLVVDARKVGSPATFSDACRRSGPPTASSPIPITPVAARAPADCTKRLLESLRAPTSSGDGIPRRSKGGVLAI